MNKPDLTKVKRVLIIRARAIGDVILTTPMIRAIRKALPDAEIDFMVEPFAAPALEGNPYISNIILLKRHKMKKELPSVRKLLKPEDYSFLARFGETIGLYSLIMGRKYDVVFDLWGNLRTAMLTFFSGAKYRAGFNYRVRKYFYNLRFSPDIKTKYNVYYHMDLLKTAGIPEDGGKTDFFIFPEDEKFADDYLKSVGAQAGGKIIGINGMGSWFTKRWQTEKFAGLIDALVKKDKNYCFIITWGPGEKELAEKIFTTVKENKNNVMLAPDTSIKQLGALIKKFDLLVTNDGAPKHIAVAVGTPTLTIFGPTNYKAWGPSDNPLHLEVHSADKCAPCEKMSCDNFICMENISVEEVLEKSLRLLESGR